MFKGMIRLCLACALVIWGASCGPAGDKEPEAGGAKSEGVDVEKARRLLSQAEKARQEKQFDKARALLAKANRFADTSTLQEIQATIETIDRRESKLFAKQIAKLVEDGKCAEALDSTAAMLKKNKGTALAGQVRRRTNESNVACLDGLIGDEESLPQGRKLAIADDTRLALGKAAYDELQTKVFEKVVAGLMKAVEEPLGERRWEDVVARLDEAVMSGQAGAPEREEVLQLVRQVPPLSSHSF